MPELSNDQRELILAELRSQKMIQAVKLYRDFTHVDLAAAKTAVEQLAADNGIAPSKSGCSTSAVLLLAIPSLIYLLLRH